MTSIFLLRLLSASCAMKLTARMMLKIKIIVAMTKIVAKESTLFLQMFKTPSFRLLSNNIPAEGLFGIIKLLLVGTIFYSCC